MVKKKAMFAFVIISCLFSPALIARQSNSNPPPIDPNTARLLEQYTGSKSCRPCHERFYTLWSTSHHGQAMQPYTSEFAEKELTPQADPLPYDSYTYQAKIDANKGWVLEKGPDGEKNYPIEHVMGGKNVYFFLTPMEKGRLQVLPVSYDVRKKEWYNTTASMIRHFPDATDEQVDWKDPLLTFNAACHNCHASQLSTNYDFDSDTYHTTWAEPGINCETCHGPGQEHIQICVKAEADNTPLPNDLKMPIIQQKYGYTAHQVNTNCSLCHTKGSALTTTYQPGDNYYDHYDLVTLENPDFYPDGRDLGENYTYTLWRMSPCVKNSNLDCMHCHTSSGRFRFRDNPNQSCLPCHEERVKNAIDHSRHPEDSEGNQCIACHMPMTDFARMRRSDHSMRPPMPAATMAFQSPNACNLCHTDKSPEWADQQVRQWRKRDYQKPVLHVGGLIAAARKNDWSRLEETLDYLQDPGRNEIYANSLVRLLQNCPDQRKRPVIMNVLQNDPSPLVRSSAVVLLADFTDPESTAALLKAAQDEYRIVRIRAGSSLVGRQQAITDPKQQAIAAKAVEEYRASITVRPDHWSSYYNMGNFHMNQGRYREAIQSYKTARKFRSDVIMPLVNLSFAYNFIGENEQALQALQKAAEIEPDNSVMQLNLALLLGEMNRIQEAEEAYKKVIKLDPKSAVAAYNLGVITAAKGNLDQGIAWTQKAWQLEPDEHKYGYTYAFYLAHDGNLTEAVHALRTLVDQQSDYADVYLLLGSIYEKQEAIEQALDVYRKAVDNTKLPAETREQFRQRIEYFRGKDK